MFIFNSIRFVTKQLRYLHFGMNEIQLPSGNYFSKAWTKLR